MAINHYPHHIGDFDRATRHLSRLERSVYRDLMDLYYDSEARLTLDMAALCRRIIARSTAERAAVVQVLGEFFLKTDTGWYHSRCEDEIAAYQANGSQRALAGKASAEARRLKKEQEVASGSATGHAAPLNLVGKSVVTPVQRDGNGEATNQNQNQNQNQDTHTTAGDQTQAEPSGSARVVSVASSVCMAMKAVGIGSTNPAHPDLLELISKGADIGLFVAAAKGAVKKQNPFAYALGTVKGQMRDAAALAETALAAPQSAAKHAKHAGFSSLNYHEGIEADGSFA